MKTYRLKREIGKYKVGSLWGQMEDLSMQGNMTFVGALGYWDEYFEEIKEGRAE